MLYTLSALVVCLYAMLVLSLGIVCLISQQIFGQRSTEERIQWYAGTGKVTLFRRYTTTACILVIPTFAVDPRATTMQVAVVTMILMSRFIWNIFEILNKEIGTVSPEKRWYLQGN